MTTFKKIKKWAKENNYTYYSLDHEIILSKDSISREEIIEQRISIDYDFENDCFNRIESFTLNSTVVHDKQELESWFIPLNNVKRDEKLLREYLENE